LEVEPDRLTASISDALKNRPPWAAALMLVDQFEELITVCAKERRTAFLGLLNVATAGPRLRVILAMRADFYHRLIEEDPGFAGLLRERGASFPLAAPGIGALFEMVAAPAGRAGVEFDPGLVQRVLDDAGRDPGALALVAFALQELFERKTHDGCLTQQA